MPKGSGNHLGPCALCWRAIVVQGDEMSTLVIILIVLLLLGALGSFPAWPHSASWGYGPSGGIGLIVVILIILLLFRVI